MREPLSIFLRHRWEDGVLPPALLKLYVKTLLLGLYCLHSEYQIIHTDLNLDNVMVNFENPSVLENFVQLQPDMPMHRKTYGDRTIYLSHNNFGELRDFRVLPNIADFGSAQLKTKLRYLIQKDLYRYPEVILRTVWTYSADIWNLGVMIWDMMQTQALFRHQAAKEDYNAQAHIGEMIALLWYPPRELADRERQWRETEWEQPCPYLEGKPCRTPYEYFGGPFFNAEDQFINTNVIPTNVSLEDSVLTFDGEEKRLFLDFARKMLQWLPEERKTAGELLGDPWLGVLAQ